MRYVARKRGYGWVVALGFLGCGGSGNNSDSGAGGTGNGDSGAVVDDRSFVPEALVLEDADMVATDLEIVASTLDVTAGRETWLVAVRNNGTDILCGCARQG